MEADPVDMKKEIESTELDKPDSKSEDVASKEDEKSN